GQTLPRLADTDGVRDRADRRTRGGFGDAGFNLIEQIIAMVVIVIVLLGLLSTIGATTRGVVTGRQRTIAVSLAKQVIERLQGADYADVATGTGVTADMMLVGGKFESEDLVVGATDPYRAYPDAVGTTFSLRTFVTTAPAGYRRVTVIIDWPAISPNHSMRFSSLVYPLVYTSYPVSGGSAEVTGGLITLSGCLGGDAFSDVNVVLPGARADTRASTVRTAFGVAASPSKHVEVLPRSDSSSCTPAATTQNDVCSRTTAESIADNDSTSSTADFAEPVSNNFDPCANVATAGGVTVVAPLGTMATRAKTDNCASSCSFYGTTTDAVPFVDARVDTTTESSAKFSSGGLDGNLWNFGSGWSATASVDHDTTGTAVGIVKTSILLHAPALSVLSLTGVLDGLVKVGAFDATASAASGYTTTDATASAVPIVQLWNGSSYEPVSWVPGSDPYTAPAYSIVVGERTVTYTLTVQSQQATSTVVAGTPRTDALAQQPSLLVVTLVVSISPSTLVTPTTTTTPVGTTVATTPTPVANDFFTIEVDYGRVLAHGTWLAKAA
ncbi:MAG: hypothetical protein ABI862_13410, partial [Ilumatobacteraceae bacterium]